MSPRRDIPQDESDTIMVSPALAQQYQRWHIERRKTLRCLSQCAAHLRCQIASTGGTEAERRLYRQICEVIRRIET